MNNVVINVTQVVRTVEVNATPNLITITVNSSSGGAGGTQTLTQTLGYGRNTGGKNILVNDNDAIELENGSLLKKGTYDFGANGGISRVCSVGYEDMWQGGIRHVFDNNGFIRHSTNCFNIIPDASFDSSLRFKIGSIWTLDNGDSYICTDATLGAAVWESFNLTATALDALKRDGSNANSDLDLGAYAIKAREIVTQTNGATKTMTLKSSNVTGAWSAEWQDKDYGAIADMQDLVDAILALKDGVASPGDTLQKLYNLILGASAEAYVSDIAERDAYDIPHLPFSIFVIDDGDGRWAKYQATTTGVGANFVKLSDPDLLNAVMSAAAIKAAYESNSDTNAFTNALKTKLEGIDLSQYLLVSNISDILTGTSTTKALSEAQGKVLKDLVDTKQQTITDIIFAQIISSLNAKTTLANNDSFPIYDSGVGTPTAKRVSFTSLKAFLKTYFDTLYQTALVFIAENIANKQNSLSTDGTGTMYPTVDAVNAGLINVNTDSTNRDTVKLSENISKGQAVYISGANGTNIIVSKASNATESTSSKTIGLVETTGVTNDIITVITDGFAQGLNTSSATIGDAVWLGVNGDLIFGLVNKPVAPAHLVYIGVVSRVHATQGEILVKVQNGFELKEIHDVAIASVADKQLLSYDSATGLWKNKSVTTADISDSAGKRYQSENQNTFNDATSSIQTQLDAKQAILSYTPFKWVNATQTAHTGTTLETIVATATINGGTFPTTEILKALFGVNKPLGTSGYTIRLRINTSNSLSGATTIGTFTGTGTAQVTLMSRSFSLLGGNLYGYPFTTSQVNDVMNVGGALSSTTYNTANTLYMFWTVQLGNSGDSVTPNLANLTN
jgi:hypothetical protein